MSEELDPRLKEWLATVSPEDARRAAARVLADVEQVGQEIRAATGDRFPIAEALRLIRTRQGLTQTAASKLEGAPDFRTLSHWETRRKMPSVRLLDGYLRSLGKDFIDLQEALDLVEGKAPRPVRDGQEEIRRRADDLEQRMGELEQRVQRIEAGSDGEASTAGDEEAADTDAGEASDKQTD